MKTTWPKTCHRIWDPLKKFNEKKKRKEPDVGKDWIQEKGTTEDEMVEWLYRLDLHEFQQTLGDGEEERSLVSWSPWGCK